MAYLRRCVGYCSRVVSGNKNFVVSTARGRKRKNALGTLQSSSAEMARARVRHYFADGRVSSGGPGLAEGKRLSSSTRPLGSGHRRDGENIVSEDEIAGERKHRDPRSFAPSHKNRLHSPNDLFEIPSDPAVFRRLRPHPLISNRRCPTSTWPPPRARVARHPRLGCSGLAGFLDGGSAARKDGLRKALVRRGRHRR